MTTLISWFAGGQARRCDASCHEAEHPECTCICGGRFHGISARSRTEPVDVLEEAGRELKDELGGEVELPALQLTIFDMLAS